MEVFLIRKKVIFLTTPLKKRGGNKTKGSIPLNYLSDGIIYSSAIPDFTIWPRRKRDSCIDYFFPNNNAVERCFNFKNKLTSIYQRNYYSTVNKTIHSAFIAGFTDGEGCFHVSVRKTQKYKVGWRVELIFEIGLNKKNIAFLKEIKNLFNIGSNLKQGSQLIQFIVYSVKDIKVIIDHFDKYPLITDKNSDFKLFKQVYQLMEQK